MKTHARCPRLWLAGLAAIAFAVSGCSTATNELRPSQEQLKVATKAPLGKSVVDDSGRTVYLFEKDEADESYCDGACASVWPPVTTKGMPKVEDGLDPGKITLLKRENGLEQVVYNGHPLYYYQADTDSEDAYGQKQDQFGGRWYAVTPTGKAVESNQQQGHHQRGGNYGY